ncbi:MAG: sensory rhodopsin transducer [Anaerolineae bacterium]
MTTHYLLDHHFMLDEAKGYGEFGHLLAFNPGAKDAQLNITLYFEDREPVSFTQLAPAGKSTESNYGHWPIKPTVRFAMAVESDQPIVCQSTVGWNVTMNSYDPRARTKSPRGIRECAKSYMAITQLARDWYLPDGIVIDGIESIYVRESEWALLLNPGAVDAQVTMALHYDDIAEHKVTVPARRLRFVYMDEIARRNKHYGVHFQSDQPLAAQWLRTVNWYDSDEIMCYWSVPCVPGPLT